RTRIKPPVVVAPVVAPAPVYAAPVPQTIRTRTEAVGQAIYDPDPQTHVYETPSMPQRRTFTGPYGPGGTQETVTGTYVPPSTRTYVERDVLPHPVNPVNPVIAAPSAVVAPVVAAPVVAAPVAYRM